MTTFPCFKCSGTGEVAFRHIAGGVCFQCGGSGKLAYKGRKSGFEYQDKPGFPVLPEAERSTMKQWDCLARITNDSGDAMRRAINQAGCPHATQVYVSRAVMSRAISIARAGA